MGLIEKAVNASNLYENCNTDLKKKYLIKYINLYKEIVSEIPGYKGSFGTGYPFYALGENYEGRLPVIEEQLRYNNELLHQLRYLSLIGFVMHMLQVFQMKLFGNVKNVYIIILTKCLI